MPRHAEDAPPLQPPQEYLQQISLEEKLASLVFDAAESAETRAAKLKLLAQYNAVLDQTVHAEPPRQWPALGLAPLALAPLALAPRALLSGGREDDSATLSSPAELCSVSEASADTHSLPSESLAAEAAETPDETKEGRFWL